MFFAVAGSGSSQGLEPEARHGCRPEATLLEQIKLLKQTETEVWLQLIPIRRAELVALERAVLILDVTRYVPKAVQMFDPTGSETVHVFQNVKINSLQDGQVIPAGIENLEQPNLQGLRPAVQLLNRETKK